MPSFQFFKTTISSLFSFAFIFFHSPLLLLLIFFSALLSLKWLSISALLFFLLFCLYKISLHWANYEWGRLFYAHLQLKAIGQTTGEWGRVFSEQNADVLLGAPRAFEEVPIDPQFLRNLRKLSEEIAARHGLAPPEVHILTTTHEFFFALRENPLVFHLIFSQGFLETSTQEQLRLILLRACESQISGVLAKRTNQLKDAYLCLTLIRITSKVANFFVRPFGPFGSQLALALNGSALRFILSRYNVPEENDVDPWIVEMLSRFSYERLPK